MTLATSSDGRSSPTVIWDQHCCVPLDGSARATDLVRCQVAGFSCVSLNVGYAPQGPADVERLLAGFRAELGAQPDTFVLGETVADVDAAAASGRLAVVFDLEDSNPLGGDPGRVEAFYRLGVRSLVVTYNSHNAAGYGCLDDPDGPLSPYGREVVAAMNRVGMVVDASHCSRRTSFDLMEASTAPVMFSHSSCDAVWAHERNVTDEQIRACAETGGVIGITGVGIFLGENDTSIEALLRHVDHAVSLVGPDHVGIGSDFTFDLADLRRELDENPQLFPDSYTRWGPIDFVAPQVLAQLPDQLRGLGYDQAAIDAVMGGSFRRLAGDVWR